MRLSHQDGKTLITSTLIAIVILVVGGYSYYQSRNIIHGPQIFLENPRNGATVTDALINIEGAAKNVSYMSLNNRQIYVDNSGRFTEQLLLSPGYNVWEIQAKDKFGRTVSKKIELVFSNNS